MTNENPYDDDCCSYANPTSRLSDRGTMPAGEPIIDKTSPALRKAIQDELKEMVVEELSHSMLNQVHRFANIAQELIMVRSPIADVRQRRRSRNPIGPYSANYVGGIPMGGTGEPLEENSLTGEAADNESFGSKLTREIISAVGKLGETQTTAKETGFVEELVEGVAAAKKAGLDDLANKLGERLHDLLSKQFLEDAAQKIEDEKDEPIPRDRALVGPINGTAVSS